MPIARIALALLAAAGIATGVGDPTAPRLDRIEPLGGQRGSAVEVTLVGANLSAPAPLEFDSPHLAWEPAGTAGKGKLGGRVLISADAPVGPHLATLSTPLGRANSRLFYVDEFPSVPEAEPNDVLGQAQAIELAPQVVQGAMHDLPDIDVYKFSARAGERWTFDLRSLEYGGFLENDMALLDAGGQQVAFSDDRDDYLETPFLEHVFESSGTHYLKLDQYRGPQRVNCSRNCGYMLRIGQLPVAEAAFPLGLRPGARSEISVRGRALADVEQVWIAPVRRAEYYRLTFPFTIPVQAGPRPESRIDGTVVSRAERELTARFDVPASAWTGLWRLWLRGPGGLADAISLEMSSMPQPDCTEIAPTPRGAACDGALEGASAERDYRILLEAGQPLVATTLAVQLGLPRIDTVLELFDEAGELVAEHDDLMTGQGTVIGNPDSLLYFKAPGAGRYRLVVRDRIGRTGPDMVYRLRLEEREPGFALLSDPENLNVAAGATRRVGILLIPEPGFEEPVEAWLEDGPPGVTAAAGRFRTDQYFGPSGDGDNVVIPTAFLDLAVPDDLPSGDYPLRILARAAGRGGAVEALSTLWIGPPRMRNDVRRPLPAVRLTVLDQAAAEGAALAAQAAPGASR